MSAKQELPTTLVVAEDAALRRRVCQAVEPFGDVESLAPGELQPASRFLDVPIVILAVAESDLGAGEAALENVAMLPGWSNGLLLTQELPAEPLDGLLARMRPAQVLPADVEPAILRRPTT